MATDDEVAAEMAARGFLIGEWAGAVLLLASFTQLYFAVGSHAYSGNAALVAGVLVGVVGALAYLRSRTYYNRVGRRVAPRWHLVAAVVAGSAGIFWLLFLLLALLTLAGVAILPE